MINNDSRNKFTALNIPAHFNFEKKTKCSFRKQYVTWSKKGNETKN